MYFLKPFLFFRSVLLVCFLFMVWLGGLLWFVESIPSAVSPQHIPKVDGIVVLTGGNGRIAEALKLLQMGKAPRLLISGVLDKAPVGAVVAASGYRGPLPLDRITVDYQATSTVENAHHSYLWCKEQGLQTIILVTADYHMRRSLLEFNRRTSNLTIIPYPVNPLALPRNAWCKDYKVFCLYLLEYHKYIGAVVRQLIYAFRAQARELGK